MRNNILVSLLLLAFSFQAVADEGMWLPSLAAKLNMQAMHQQGCMLTAEEIYSINNSSIKDAVVALDHGSCSGELISEEGLVLTNHHCGFGEIQAHSSVEHDYLKNGFWAMSREEELSNPGKTMSFLIRVEDVTEKITSKLTNEMTEEERTKKVLEISDTLKNKAIKDTHYEAKVKSMLESNSYYLFVYETFKDIRLVGCPPSSIGKFGGDTDNWMWPRHTGDFCLFRIYCGPDGKPADFSDDNVPYHPKHHFPVSLKGIEDGDFAMVMGYPGRTNRYMTSYGVKYLMEVTNPTRVKVRTRKLDLLREFMKTSDKARIQYASKYARSSNYWKYSIGQNKGLARLKVQEKKKAIETDFIKWIEANDVRQAEYGEALSLIAAYYDDVETSKTRQLVIETLLAGPEIFRFAYLATKLRDLLKENGGEKNKEALNVLIAKMKKDAAEFYDDYDQGIDLKIAIALSEMYRNDAPSRYYPSFFTDVDKKAKGDFAKYLKKAYSKSIFPDPDRLNEFLDQPNLKTLEKDQLFIAGVSINDTYKKIVKELEQKSKSLNKGRRLFLKGLMSKQENQAFYPDANSTMRMTYGNVKGYHPRDAVDYLHYTTIDGYLEKEDPESIEFYLTPRMKELLEAEDWGQYANDEGTVPTCFITNNDITGGNSGSPVINGNGELIGTAFDGNWEAMSGDIAFENDLQRCICVDARFVLWVIDKYAGATHLIDEMTIAD